MSSAGARPFNSAAVQDHPPVDRSYEWEENYRRRARTMHRDYVNPNSTRISHQVSQGFGSRPQHQQTPRPAVSNPQLLESSKSSSWGTPSNSELSQHRAQCLNMFYPTEDEVRARLTYGVQYPSQLPKPAISSHQDNYDGLGSSTAATTISANRTGTYGTTRMLSGMVDPYVSDPTQAPGPIVPKRHDYDYLKNSLIMFGDETSWGTGLSEQELLHRKQKEETKAKFRAKKNQRNRIVSLPSSLLGRQQQLQRRDQGSSGDRLSSSPITVEREYEPPPPQIGMKRHPAGRDINPRMLVSSPDPPADQARKQNTITSHASEQTGRRKNISSSRSSSKSQSPARDENESGVIPSPPRPVHPASINPQKASSQDVPLADNLNGSNFMFVAHKRPMDPPSRKQQPVMDYDYSVDDSAGWDEEFAMQLMNVLPRPSETTRRRDVGATHAPCENEEEWPDPGMVSQLDESDELDGEEGYRRNGRNQKGRFTSPQAQSVYKSQTKYVSQKLGNDFAAFASPATAATASMTFEASRDLSSDFDPFQAPDPVATVDVGSPNRPYGPEPKASFGSSLSRQSRSDITRNIDDLLAATAPSPSPTLFNARSGYSPSALLNNPPGLNMDEYAPHKPDAPATAFAMPRGQGMSQKNTSHISVAEFLSPNVRWSENLEQKQTPRRTIMQQPKSILRNSRIRHRVIARAGFVTDQTQRHIVRSPGVNEKPVSRGQYIPENAVDISFVGEDGRSLSPITSVDGKIEVVLSTPDVDITSAFERNIPQVFQQAFTGESTGRYGERSPSYSDFIEAVACVVIQTSVRRFLARIRMQKIQRQRAFLNQSEGYRGLGTRASAGRQSIQSNQPRNPQKVQLNMFALAAIRIQAMFRGWHARDNIAVDHYCATIIQQLYRRYRAQNQFATYVYCAVAIQSAFRGHRIRQQTLVHKQHSAHLVSARRNYRPSKKIDGDRFRHPSKAIEHLAATMIQSCARAWMTRRIVSYWVRSSRTQTVYLFKPERESKQNDPFSAYSLPQSYHAHTAFMQQSVPSPVRSSASASPQNRLLNVAYDEELEVYHKKIDQEMAELTKRDQRKGLIKARTNDYLHNSPKANRWQAPPAPRVASSVKDEPSKEGTLGVSSFSSKPEDVRSYRDIAKATSQEQTSASVGSGYATRQEISKPASFRGDTPQREEKFETKSRSLPVISRPTEIDSSNGARPSSVLASRNDRAISGNNPTSDRGGQSESFQRHIVGASQVNMNKPAWMVNLEKNKSQNKVGDPPPAVQSEAELTAPNSNTTVDWKSRLKKTKSKDDSPAQPDLQVLPPSKSESWRSRLRVTKSTEEQIVSMTTGRKMDQPNVQEYSTPEEFPKPLKEIVVNDEKKDDDGPQLESSDVVDIRNPPEGGTSEPSAPDPTKPVTRGEEPEKLVVTAPVPLVASIPLAPSKTRRLPVPVGDPLKSNSPVHLEMRSRRSESEQLRLDAMHHIFLRTGLIGRREKETISFAHTSSAQYQANHDDDFRPAARDLIHAWKDSDQTQPVMTGKLF